MDNRVERQAPSAARPGLSVFGPVAPRCRECGGNCYLEPLTADDISEIFVGFEAKCLACSRGRYVEVEELAALWQVPVAQILHARVSSLAFLWRRDAA